MLKASALLHKIQRFVFVSHEVCTSVAGDDDGAAGIAHAGGLMPVPAFQVSIDKTAGKSIARAQNVIDFYRKARSAYGSAILQKGRGALWPAFHDQRLRAKNQQP